MWKPTDMTAFPTPIDLVHAREAIKATEKKLKDALQALAEAQRSVADLEQDLLQRRAWIAPVRRLPLEVLSLIFELCGEDYWETPLRISEVSREWRAVVLTTPRAWAFLDLDDIACDTTGIDVFFRRSGNLPLHIYLPDSSPASLLVNVEERLKCLSFTKTGSFSEESVFPLLDRLKIRSEDHRLDISYFNDLRFPSLQHLLCNEYITGIPVASLQGVPWAAPPLQTLSLLIESDMDWISLLDACKGTLVSLKLESVLYLPEEPRSMTLTALRCLEIDYWTAGPQTWRLDLKTPALECYVESTNRLPDGTLDHRDVATVRKLRLDCPPTLSSFPLLQLIQLKQESHVSAVLSQLASNHALCPNLQEIELALHPERLDPDIVNELEELNRHRVFPIELVARTRLAELPYAIISSPCGENMPCHEVR